jgi:acetyltransferase
MGADGGRIKQGTATHGPHMQNVKNLDALFNPATVAVIGASATPGKIGHTVVRNMLDAGFEGRLIPVNPKSEEIEGLEVVRNVADLPSPLDLAVITIPRDLVVDTLRELAELPARAAIVITAGFKEVGKEGYHLEEELIRIAEDADMALLGPNCLGMINTKAKVNASFAAGEPPEGNIAFFSQSGALCVAILDWAMGENIGFSKFISLGNKAVISESDMLVNLTGDRETSVVLGYVENVANGCEFMEAARRISSEKPVIMIKSGTTAAGAKAASSHTGAIAGSEAAYNAAFRQSGIMRVNDVQRLFNLAQAFSNQPLPRGPGLAIVTNSGGPGILAADATEKSQLNIAKITADTVQKMKDFLPPYASLYNPIDIIGDASAERYKQTMEVVIEDNNVQAMMVLLTPTASVEVRDTAKAVIEVAAKSDKPIFGCFMGQDRVSVGQRMLQEAGIPCYAFPEPCIDSIDSMYSFYLWQRKPEPEYVEVKADKEAVRRVLDEANRWGAREIVEFQAQEILKAYDLPIPETRLARTSDEATQAAAEIGFPVVLKIASAHISHKSDVEGVKVGLADEQAVREAFLDITSRAQRMRPEAYISGCLIQSMAPKGCKEVIIGFKRDDQFGPLIMFGLGGIYVEVLKDISFRLAPVSRNDAKEMIREIKSYMLLKGFRGEPAIDFEAVEHIILAMSQLATDFPDIYEAEFNPVLVNDEQAVVADVRLSLVT